MIVVRAGFLLHSARKLVVCSGVGGRGVVLDEIDTCIRNLNSLSISPQKSGFKSLPMRTFLGSGH